MLGRRLFPFEVSYEHRRIGRYRLCHHAREKLPAIRQFTIFLENQVGKLLEVIRRFEGSQVRIVALSISDTAESALVRLLVSHPEQGARSSNGPGWRSSRAT